MHLTALAVTSPWAPVPEDTAGKPLLVELIDLPAEPAQVSQEERSAAPGPAEAHTAAAAGRRGGNTVITSAGSPEQLQLPQFHSGERQDNVASSSEGEATVSLNSQELKYLPYLSAIKKKIEPLWHYPESARTQGLQGKLALYFSIVQDGRLVRLEVLSTSGHPLLDNQALEAVQGAAPYYPLPETLHIARLNIHATFEYRMSPYRMSGFAAPSSPRGTL